MAACARSLISGTVSVGIISTVCNWNLCYLMLNMLVEIECSMVIWESGL